MNNFTMSLFDLIINAADTLKESMTEALRKYRAEMTKVTEDAKVFKAEEEYISGKKTILVATAQEAISKAQRVFRSNIERYSEQLHDELERHVSEPINSDFREQLLTIAQFRIQPSETQIKALLKANNGNSVGLSAIAKVLDDVQSPYRVNFRETKDYEDDLKMIERWSIQPIAYDADYHHEACDVMRGQRIKRIRDDLSTFEDGTTFDSIALITGSADFENKKETVKSMKNSWVCDVSYALAEQHTTAEQEAEKLKNEILRSVGADPEPNDNEYKSSTSVENDRSHEAMQLARELGKAAARSNAPMSQAVKDAYVK